MAWKVSEELIRNRSPLIEYPAPPTAELASAMAAGITTIITVNDTTGKQYFSSAAAVLNQLGEADRGFKMLRGDAIVDVNRLRKIHSDAP